MTREVAALETLPESTPTALCGDFGYDITVQVNVVACYYTCNVTNINEA
ncbi:hypothetical protein ACFQH9_11825 [Pseudonocardia lutea]|uniref:Uncharacterized protein n=1 Tax=Pseudonocardia lutea TaxID=2172015 RepID=A0ABW1I5I9_9PSEU